MKNVVASGLADRCEVQFAYAIGHPDPVSVSVNSFGTGKVSDDALTDAVCQIFSFKPADIIKQLNLLRPIYRQTAAYGHFGRAEKGFTVLYVGHAGHDEATGTLAVAQRPVTHAS